MARTRSQGISPSGLQYLVTPPRSARGRRRAAPAAPAETAPTQPEATEPTEPNEYTEQFRSPTEIVEATVKSPLAITEGPDEALQISESSLSAQAASNSSLVSIQFPHLSSDVSYERIRPEQQIVQASSLNMHPKRPRNADQDENSNEPSAKRPRPESMPLALDATPLRLPRVNLLGSVSRGLGSVLSRFFKTPQREEQDSSTFLSSNDDDPGDLSSTLDFIPASPSVGPARQRSPLSSIHLNTPTRSRESGSMTKRRLTPHEIVAMEPNYIPKSQEQIEENLRKLRYPDLPWLKDAEEDHSDSESHGNNAPVNDDTPLPHYAPTPRSAPATSFRQVSRTPTTQSILRRPAAFTPATSTPTNKKRNRVIPHGNYFDRAYASSSDGEVDDLETLSSSERGIQPRSALKQRSDAPSTVGRSSKRVKFTSPIEDFPSTIKAPRFGHTGVGSQNDFFDDDNSSFTDNSLLRSTIANTEANTPAPLSFATPSTRNYVDTTDVSALSLDESTFVPHSHHPRPSTYCFPDDWSDESLSINDTNMTISPTSPPAATPPEVAPEAAPEAISEATPADEWNFGGPQTYVEASILTQEVMDLVNENWQEEDSEDAVMFFRRGFAKYCHQVDEWEAKGFQIEIEC